MVTWSIRCGYWSAADHVDSEWGGASTGVCVNLTQGTLARDVVVKLTTMNGTAIGNTLYNYVHLLTGYK